MTIPHQSITPPNETIALAQLTKSVNDMKAEIQLLSDKIDKLSELIAAAQKSK